MRHTRRGWASRSLVAIPRTVGVASVLAALACAWGCSPTVTINATDIEITQTDLQLSGVPLAASTVGSATGTFPIDTSRLGAAGSPDGGLPKGIERLQLTRIVLAAKTGISDFAFVKRLSLVASSSASATQAGAGQAAVTIIDYQAPAGGATGRVLQPPISPPIDMLPLWGSPVLYVTVTATGNLPPVNWSMDVVFTLSVKLIE